MKKTVLLSGILALVISAAAFQFCVKPPDYPKEPVIEFLNLSKNIMRQTHLGADTILATISFTDGDGDLGFEEASESILIVDGRDNVSRPSLSIPYIEQQGAGNGISGEITFQLTSTCCIYVDPQNGIKRACETVPVNTDSVFYKISIKDRAGHISNEIRTPWIGLICK